MRTSVTGTLLAASLVLASVRGANAAVITSVELFSLPGFSTGSVGPFGATPAPNNDEAGAANPNAFSSNVFFNSAGFMEIEFNVSDSGGVTEYRVPQSFINNSGQSWSSFGFELGFGTGASFMRSTLGDGLDFDAPDAAQAPTSNRFTVLELEADALRWSGAIVPSIGLAAFGFAIDVPDALRNANPYGESRFTLRQTPNAPPPGPAPVPEPATLTLLGGGLLGLAAAGRRRRS